MDKLVENDIRKSQYLTNKCAEYLKRSGFSIIHRKEEGEGLSGYTIYCEKNTTDTIFVVRISNHIAVLENFAKHYPAPLIAKPKLARRMGKNVQPRYKKQVFRSFVFKDFDIPENNTISRKIVCPEYVFSPDNIYDNGLIDTVTNGISQSISLPDGQQPQICSVTPNIRIGRKQQLEENKQYRNTNITMKQKQTIKLNETQLRNLIKENIKKVLNEEQCVRFNWNITVSPNDAPKMYELQKQLENAKWVMDFERDDEPCEMQHLSIYPGKTGGLNEDSTDALRYEAIKEYAQEDPSTLSDGELRNRIEYMLAYRWALRGNESVLDEYMEEANRRGIN